MGERDTLIEYVRQDQINAADAALDEHWFVIRYKDGDHEVVRAESRVMARMVVEVREGGTGHDCGHPDHIGWIEGPFSRKPTPRREWA